MSLFDIIFRNQRMADWDRSINIHQKKFDDAIEFGRNLGKLEYMVDNCDKEIIESLKKKVEFLENKVNELEKESKLSNS